MTADEITTSRVRLSPLRRDDLPDLIALYADPEVMRGSSGEAVQRSPEQTERWLAAALAVPRQPWWRTFRVENIRDGRFLGRCGLRPLAGSSATELAYAFVRQHWGAGIATEAAGAVLDWGFHQGLDRVVAMVLQSNPASVRVVQKLGMRLVGSEQPPVGTLLRFEGPGEPHPGAAV